MKTEYPTLTEILETWKACGPAKEWLAELKTVTPESNQTAKLAYDLCEDGSYLIWLAEAAGIDGPQFKRAYSYWSSLPPPEDILAVKKIVPWEDIEEAMIRNGFVRYYYSWTGHDMRRYFQRG